MCPYQVAEKASNLKFEVKTLEVKSEEHGQQYAAFLLLFLSSHFRLRFSAA
jgi:hypothetical protein